MNFNKDYKDFIEELKKKNARKASPVLIRVERVAISIFVTYLNHKYADKCTGGGEHEWGIDGVHSNEYCKKCFISKPKREG